MTMTTTCAASDSKPCSSALDQMPELSGYEKTRALNILKNNARLRALGLISTDEERRSNAAALGHDEGKTADQDDNDEDDSSSDEEYNDCEESGPKKKKKRVRSLLPPREGSRKSRRLMQLPSDEPGDIVSKNETAAERKERILVERVALVEECREARQRAALEVAKAGVAMAGKENPTATYEHCLMRVRSMKEKGLINRVRLYILFFMFTAS